MRRFAKSNRLLFAGVVLCAAVGALAAEAVTPVPRAGDEKALIDVQLLGKRIFEDANLSEPRGMSCMSCHAPEHAFQGNNGSRIAAVPVGSRPDQFGARKAPTIMYKTYNPAFSFYKDMDQGKEVVEPKGGLFWDGRAIDLVDQVASPLLNPLEMNNPSRDAVVDKVKSGDYADLVKAVYGQDAFADPKAAMDALSKAVFAYEATERFAPFSSKFDDTLRGKAKLTPLEARGLALFTDPKAGNCTACHAGKPDSKDPTDWIFTDFTYVAPGAPRNPAIPANADATHFDLGLCQRPGLAEALPKETARESLCGKFKVPTLRNVAVAGPYFHNGVFKTLREAVAFYATRDTDPGHWYPKLAGGEIDKFDDMPSLDKANIDREAPYDRKPGQRPRLSDADIDALVAFLATLTDKGMR